MASVEEAGYSSDSDPERKSIREELSQMSFEELQKLKEKLGAKTFQETLKGRKRENVKTDFTRANKNRPREVSSKTKPSITGDNKTVPQKQFRRDPRFDPLCGEFNEKKFHRNFEFVYEIKKDELQKLKDQLKEETRPREMEKLQYLIQRLQNQIKAEKKRKEDELKRQEEVEQQIEAMKQGKSPYFAKKSEKTKLDMKGKFDKLKKEGKLDKYMEKKRKKNAQRDRKSLPFEKDE
nr:EOG090X0E8U [Eulimnadia texana]